MKNMQYKTYATFWNIIIFMNTIEVDESVEKTVNEVIL